MTGTRKVLGWLCFGVIPKLVVYSSMSFRVFVFIFRECLLYVEVIRRCCIPARLAGS